MATCNSSDLEFTAPMTCTLENQSAGEDWCRGSASCTQAASLGAVSAEAYGNLNTSCALQDPGRWACECNVGVTPSTFELEGTVAWDVCTAASETCQTTLDLEGNANGGDYYYSGGQSGY
jgi:hypothetical protein